MSRALLLGALLAPSLAVAAAPTRVPVQGTLANTDGTPVDGDLSVVFTLYGAADGTDPLWTETDTVSFDAGTFTVYLGELAPIDHAVFRDHTGVWLGMAVDGDAEMDLIEIDTVPYAGFAQYAGDAATVGGIDPTDLLTSSYAPSWDDLADVPPSLAAGVTAGNGITVNNGTIAVDQTVIEGMAQGVCFEDEASLHAVLDDDYVLAGTIINWTDLQGRPAGLDDGDNDTTYAAGTGLTLTGTTFAANPPAWTSLTGVPAGFGDGTDADTTYTAGAGLRLTGTAFSADATRVPVAATYTKKVNVRSGGYATGVAGTISVGGVLALTVGRSYGLVVIDRATGAVDSAVTYDVYGNAADATAMATRLNAVGANKIVVVATSDEPNNNRLANGLQAAMLRCGASRNYVDGFLLADGTRAFRYRSAYAMVGICGSGPNSGSEWYAGEIDNDATALINATVLVMDGDVIGGR